MTAEVLLLLVGGWVGFWLGVRYAEIGRARVEMRKTWLGRASWRK